ncbi:zinc ribbon domain-containing protein [Clostridium sp. D33t1_170424_F3]|uniref:zinc ribbon domain-containing protein n=1 Tax=Clostridium sp. D33t1_170424_F3 TaxID=2787099 RepID=UPI0018AA96DB|nr:zinc ribbon domain-containing protein [Clostridium sp. D33t1_170424_F3]
MKCQNCGTENPEEARFCMNCSVRLRPLVCLKKDPLPPAFLDCEPVPAEEDFYMEPVDDLLEELPEEDDTCEEPFDDVLEERSENDDMDLSKAFAEDFPMEKETLEVSTSDIMKKFAKYMAVFTLFLIVVFAGFCLLMPGSNLMPYPPRDVQIDCEDHRYTFVGAEEYLRLATNAPSSTLDNLQFISYYPNVATFERVNRDGEIQGKLTAVSEGETYICLDNSSKRSELVLVTVIDAESGRLADMIEEEIAAIGKVTLDKEDMIHELKRRYDALSDQAKGRVKSAEILTKAEAQLKKLHQMQSF